MVGDGLTFNWAWSSQQLSEDQTVSIQQLNSMLSGVRLSAGKDAWSWQAGKDGVFYVKSTKRLLFSDSVAGSWFVMDWCRWVPAKVNIHSWRMEMNKLPTGEGLRKRNIAIDDIACPMCNSEEETVDHVFIACRVAAIIWSEISSWCKIPNIFAFSTKDLLCLHSTLRVSERKKVAVQGIIMVACWSLWRARNNSKYSNAPVKIDGILSDIKALSHFWFSYRSKYKEVEWKDWVSFVNM
ncbi:putative reverse transcriptase zinc-binding domain-containing protein [Helianthus anomalus]